MPINVLLTGGAGYIGSHTAASLADAGYGVVIYDNFCNSKPEVIRRLIQLTGQPLAYVAGDVRNTELVEITIRKHDIGAVIHFAGLKSVADSVSNPIDYYSNNVEGAISLVKAMQTTEVKTLVFSSSATVYGEPRYLPIDEDHGTGAINPYGRTKLQVEHALADLARSDSKWHIVCLRYFNPAGAHDSGLIGEDPNGVPNNLVPYLARVAAGRLPRVQIFGNDYATSDGTGVRDYIHVVDLAEGHLAALRYLQNYSGWHAINLGTGKGHSVFDMIRAFEGASETSIPFEIKSRRPGDIATCFAGVDKAAQLLQWQARRSIHDMCRTMWNWQSKVTQIEAEKG